MAMTQFRAAAPIGESPVQSTRMTFSAPTRGILDPFIVINRALRLPTGPQPVDEHSILVALAPWVVVDADNFDVTLHHTHWFPIHSDEAIRSQIGRAWCRGRA